MIRPLALLAALHLAGCASTTSNEETLPLPAGLQTTLERFVGSGLTGPLPRVPEFGDDLITLKFELRYLERVPESDLGSLSLQADFIANPASRDPLEPASILATEAVVGRGEQATALHASIQDGVAGRTNDMLTRSVALPVGATAVLMVRRLGVFHEEEFAWRPDPVVQAIEQEFSLHVSRLSADEPLQLLARLSGPLPVLSSNFDEEPDPVASKAARQSLNERTAGPSRWGPLVEQNELIIPSQHLEVGAGPVMLLGRSPFERGSGRGMALFIEATDDAQATSEEDLAALREELEAEARAAARLISEEETALSRNRTLARALDRLSPDSDGRRTLAVLAGAVDASLCTDFALVASPELFAGFLESLAKERAKIMEVTSKEQLAWILERNVYALLAKLDAEDRLPAELAGVLLREAGEVGRYTSSIEDAILISPDLATFRRLTQEENLVFLEDPDPSSRVRAYDWLRKTGVHPEGYDPLAPAKERRAALARYEDALAGAAEEESP